MKNNAYHLINAVLRGAWFMEPQSAAGYLPLFLQTLKGEKINDDLLSEVPKTKFIVKSMEDDDWSESEEAPKESENVEGVAIISLVGPVMKYDYCFSPGTQTMAQQIEDVNINNKLKGAIMYIDSPGGEALAMEVLHTAIKNSAKPVIAVVEGMCCSAAYGIAAACDQIFAAGDSCIIGSIGTMISFTDMRGWKEFEGINFHEIYASKSVDKNKDFRDALDNNYATIKKDMLDPLNEFFIGMVDSARPGMEESKVFTGKVYLTKKAIEEGLVDERGTIKNAINTIMFGSKFKKLDQFKGKQNLSEAEALQIEQILAEAGLSVKLEKPKAEPVSLSYETAEGETIYVYAEEGEDPVGKRCVYADAEGQPTEEVVPEGEHPLKNGGTMMTSVDEADGFSYVDEIIQDGASDEEPSEKKKDDEEETPAKQIKKVVAKKVSSIKSLSKADRDALAKTIADQIISSTELGLSPASETNGNGSAAQKVFAKSPFQIKQEEIQERYKQNNK